MNLLADHRREGRLFEPLEIIEEGMRLAVRLAVSDPHWPERGETFKVFTFDANDDVVLMQDCTGREHALALLSS